MEFRVTDVAQALGLTIESEARVTGWSIDSRTIAPGDLFFALRGPNHDGNAYVEEVLRKGAVAAVANVPLADESAWELRSTAPFGHGSASAIEQSHGVTEPRPQGVVSGHAFHADSNARDAQPSRDREGALVLVVPDTLEALQTTAVWALKQWGGEVIGVTGSAGKTSTKDVIAALLAAGMPVGKTIGNLNNHVGVPLSILRLPIDAPVAVLEMGMNHAGEIRDLCAIAKPRIGVVTNVGHAHMEAFDSIAGVAAAKRELIESLPPNGVAVLNADDPLVSQFRAAHPGYTITFGIDSPADFRADDVEITGEGIRFKLDGVQFESTLLGRHSVLNILAGIAVASLYGLRPRQLSGVVKDLQASSMRGQRLTHDGVLILNDCYNSNPDAARVMIDVLRDTPAKRRIAVLGEMLELGRWSEALHRDVGSYVAKSGIDVLVGIRGEACHLVDAARRSGLAVDAAFFFPDAAAAGERLRGIARPGDVILMKGSRGTHVEHALERFLARPN